MKAIKGILIRTRIISVASLIISLSLFPAASQAITISGDSNTYLQFRQAIGDSSRLAPLYEYLDFRIDDIGSDSLSFHYGGWGKVDLGDKSFGKSVDGDLQYAFVSYKSEKNNTVLNMGRMFIAEGVAAEKVDGVYARTDLKGGFTISAYAGSPVEEVSIGEGGDSIFGGRLAYQIPAVLTLGVSGLKEDGGTVPRSELGADIWLRPLKTVDITGRSTYNAITDGWMEHTYRLSMGPYGAFRLNSEASWISYKDYFASTTNPVFNLMPGILNPAEKLRILGQEVAYALNDNITLSVDYKNYGYDIQGSANYFGGKIAYSVPGSGGAGFAAHRMDGETDALKYSEFRLYGFKKFGKADFTLDLIDIDYAQRLNGVENAYSASLAAGYDFTEKFRVSADVDYYHNPVYNHDIRTLLHLVCKFDTASASGSASGGSDTTGGKETK